MQNALSMYLWVTVIFLTVTHILSRDSDRTSVAPFDTDIRKDCRGLLSLCQSDVLGYIFLQCPKLCSAMLEVEGMVGKAPSDDELWWESTESVRTIQGKRISTDRWDGSVSVVATVPLLPGMAPYFYEMMETLHKQFAPHVEMVIIPIDTAQALHIQLRENPAVVVLEEESPTALLSHPFVGYLTSIKPQSGAANRNHRDEVEQLDLHTDRATFFVISADGYFIESLISPTMKKLQQRIALYLKTIDYAEAEL
jgi:hypothetical protein